MSRPEPSDNILRSDHASRGSGEFYRLGRTSAAEGEEAFAKGDLSRLRQSLGPQPEVVHVPQPTRRLGWFAAGFVIALAVGVVIGWLAIAALPSIIGKGSGTKTAELTARSDNSKSAVAANSPANGSPAAPTAPQAFNRVRHPRVLRLHRQPRSPPTARRRVLPQRSPRELSAASLTAKFGSEFPRHSAVQPKNLART